MASNKDYDAVRYRTETFGVKTWAAMKIALFYLLLFAMAVIAIRLYAYLGRLIIQNAVILTVLAC